MPPVKVTVHILNDRKNASETRLEKQYNFESIPDAKEYCLYLASIDYRCKYFYHFEGENIDMWFVVERYRELGRRTPVPKIVEVYAPFIGWDKIVRKSKIEKAKKNLEASKEWLETRKKNLEEWLHIEKCEGAALTDAQERLKETSSCLPGRTYGRHSHTDYGAPARANYSSGYDSSSGRSSYTGGYNSTSYDDGRRSREDRGSGYYERETQYGGPRPVLFRPDGSEVTGFDPD